MKRLITLVLVVLSFYSCTDNTLNDNSNQDCGSLSNVAYESFNYCGKLKENPTQPTYLILNSNEELQKFFDTCNNPGTTLPDFTQKRILGLMSGPKPTGGYEIKIQSVIENDCQIIVEYFEKAPNDGDNVTMAVTYPANFIVLPKSNKPILFSKVNKIVDYAIVGTYYGQCTGANCYQFYKIESFKVLQYLNISNLPTDFSQLDYKALVNKDDFSSFLLKVPAEIKDLKGQTKTFGSPDSHDQGGIYFEWSQGGVVSKIYLDSDDSVDQTPNVIAFKKAIKDKIAELKTKS